MQLLNRRSPFGYEVIASANEFPQYSVTITEVDVYENGKDDPVEVELSIECGLTAEQTITGKLKKQKNRGANTTVVLTLNSDLDLIDFRRIP
jgi:ATP-dependent DNA helicase HFM1/MER3